MPPKTKKPPTAANLSTEQSKKQAIMLSYMTIIAIQLLRIIRDAGDDGHTVTELKELTGLQGTAVSQVVFLLKKSGWVGLRNRNRHVVITRLEDKSLYDLVMLTDKRIQLSTHIILKHWADGAQETMQNPVKVNQGLHDSLKKRLQKIRISDLVKVVRHKDKEAMTQKK